MKYGLPPLLKREISEKIPMEPIVSPKFPTKLKNLSKRTGTLCLALCATVLFCKEAAAIATWTPANNWAGRNVSKITSKLPSKSVVVGNFIVDWHGVDSGQSLVLAIRHLENPNKILWSSKKTRPFIMAGRGNEDIFQWRGSFTIQDQNDGVKCREQSVDSLEVTSINTVVVRGRLSGPDCAVGYSFTLSPQASRRLQFHAALEPLAGGTDAQEINRLFLLYASEKQEAFYGFGEQFTYFNLKGRAVPIISQEQGHLRGLQPYTFLLNKISKGAAGAWHTTYAAVPQYITSQNRGLFLEDYEYSVFNLKSPEEVEIQVWKNHMTGQILYGETPLDLIETYTEFSGRQPALPRWFHSGAIVGVMGGSDFVREIHERLKNYDTPIAAYWLQDWVGKRQTDYGIRMWWNWSLDRSIYPDWDELVDEFNDQGIEVLGYINPFLSDASGNPNQDRNLFAEAKELGYLTTWADGSPAEIDSGGFTGTLVDLSNPAAFEWLKDVIVEELIGSGFRGWMADFGEALPYDALLQSGVPASSFHNRYPEEWARVNQEAIRAAGLEGEIVPFLRCGFTRSPGYVSSFWLGDQMVNWDEHDGLKSSITGLLSGGMSGFAINHSDIGGLIAMRKGFLGIQLVDFTRSKELLMRWAEMNAFTSVYRTHEGNNPDVSHQFYSDEETLEFFSRFAKVFALLADYRDRLFNEAATKGYPVSRHPLLHYPNDPVAHTLKTQFMLGADFMVAPVTDAGISTMEVYLPAGEWIHIWTGKRMGNLASGTWVDVDCPIGQPPVFFKADSTYGMDFYNQL